MMKSPATSKVDARVENRRRDAHVELDRRMNRPQRHRLLQGYPMAPVMTPCTAEEVPEPALTTRPLIVGVLPHPFCNPTVKGCGFCTFPHQKFHRSVSSRVVDSVREELRRKTSALPWLRQTNVPAVYVGGGTANLVPPDQMALLYADLTRTFDLTEAELTLEGAPRYFLTRDAAHLDLLAGLEVDHRRISMGVQTFDPDWIERMGRTAISAPEHVEAVVKAAKTRGITTSCDLLYNLPGQSLETMLADLGRAAAIGFDQICVYNLVLYHGLGTEWSKDAALVEAMPATDEACDNWLATRARLDELGYEQSTLTNFERRDLPERQRFRYERLSFEPEAVDGIGFGPAGLTTFASAEAPWKTMNEIDAAAYVAAVDRSGDATALAFRYAYPDEMLLHMTRQIPRMRIRRDTFRKEFGLDPTVPFQWEFGALEHRGLVQIERDAIRLTPTGMFYADSVAGLLAARRTRALRNSPGINNAQPHHMG